MLKLNKKGILLSTGEYKVVETDNYIISGIEGQPDFIGVKSKDTNKIKALHQQTFIDLIISEEEMFSECLKNQKEGGNE